MSTNDTGSGLSHGDGLNRNTLQITQYVVQAYAVPIVGLIGIITNSVSVVIFMRNRNKGGSNIHYLIFLTSVDVINCLYETSLQFADHGMKDLTGGRFHVNLVVINDWSCRILRFINQSTQMMSAWTLVMYSLERCLAVCVPLKVSSLFTKKRRLSLLCGVFVVSVGASFKTFLTFQVSRWRGLAQCYLNIHYEWPVVIAVTVVELGTIFALPCVAILLLNSVICIALFRRSRMKSVLTSKKESLSSSEMRCVFNLLGIAALYVLTTTPKVIFWTIHDTLEYIDEFDAGEINVDWDWLFYFAKLCDSVVVINYSANFLIYSLSLDWYRTELRSWLRCGKGDDEPGRNDFSTHLESLPET